MATSFTYKKLIYIFAFGFQAENDPEFKEFLLAHKTAKKPIWSNEDVIEKNDKSDGCSEKITKDSEKEEEDDDNDKEDDDDDISDLEVNFNYSSFKMLFHVTFSLVHFYKKMNKFGKTCYTTHLH